MQSGPNDDQLRHQLWGQVELSDSVSGSHHISESAASSEVSGSVDMNHNLRKQLKKLPPGVREAAKRATHHPDTESDVTGHSSRHTGTDRKTAPVKTDERWSMGSELHTAGQCKPCAWNWRPTGCIHGMNCKFCHTCADGEVKLRKKERINKKKAEKAADFCVSRVGKELCRRTTPSLQQGLATAARR
eukprot:TRINITY_DN9741_c0_g1_i4.p1 TRINITY_DN9741_c0_g1~~TRINITY_DN9741_c0_g1_i4.p1  ORF type:complete len:188 (+),score=37.62 TRINITY_DN9741_c0_g1_i4:187-750(+)